MFIFLSFFMIDDEGLFEDLDGGGSTSCSSSSLTSMAFDVTGFKLAFAIALRRVSKTRANSFQNSVKEHFDI